MQSIVRKAVRPFTVVLKGIILVLIICATGGAWAAVPVPTAIWDGNFNTTRIPNWTLSANGNTVATDGSTITITKQGLTLTPSATIPAATGVTVLVKMSDISTNNDNDQILVCTKQNNVGVKAGISMCTGARTLHGAWDGSAKWNDTNNGETSFAVPSSGDYYILFTSGNSSSTVREGFYEVGGTVNIKEVSGLRDSSNAIQMITIGGRPAMEAERADNAVVKRILVYKGCLTSDEMKSAIDDIEGRSIIYNLAWQAADNKGALDYSNFMLPSSSYFMACGSASLNSSKALRSITIPWRPDSTVNSGGATSLYLAVTDSNNKLLALSSAADMSTVATKSSTTFNFTQAYISDNTQYRYWFISSNNYNLGDTISVANRMGCSLYNIGSSVNSMNSNTMANYTPASWIWCSNMTESEFTATAGGTAVSTSGAYADDITLKGVADGKFTLGGALNAARITLADAAATIAMDSGDSIKAQYLDNSTQKLVIDASNGATAVGTYTLFEGTLASVADANLEVTFPTLGSGYELYTTKTVNKISYQVDRTAVTATLTLTADCNFSEVKDSIDWIDSNHRTLEIVNNQESPITFTFDEDITAGSITVSGTGTTIIESSNSAVITAGTVTVPLGSTIDATGSSITTGTGAGTFIWKAGYPATVPAGATYQYVGGTEESPCASSDKYTINGTLKLNGYFTLSGANTVPNASGVLEIASGKSTVTFGSNTAGVTGWIQIDSGAELVVASSDALNYESNSGGIKVYGKLSLGSFRWSFNTNNKFYLYNGGEVSGEGDSTHNCALDFYQSNRILVFGTCTISANVRTRDSDDLLTIAQARDSSLTISGKIIGAGKVKKDYATTDEGNAQANAGNSTTYFSGANTFGGTFTAADNTGYIIMRPGVAFNSATTFTIGAGNELDFGMSDGTDSASAIEFNNTVSNSGATKVYCKLTLRSGANATTWGDNFTGTVQVQSTGGLVVPATCTGESSTCNFSIVSGGKLYGGGTVVLNAFPTLTTSVLDSGWTGKVVFPAITSGSADNGFNQKVNAFGNTASTVKLLGLPTTGNSTYFSDNGSVDTTLELAEGCTLRINNGYSAVDSGKTGTIYNLTGAGTLLHEWSPSPSNKMFKISVTTVSNFTGSVQNTSSVTGCDINIVKLHFDSKPVGGARVLSATASGTGKITVGGTNINGLILVQKSDGFYSAVASYNNQNYATIQDAIDAAGDENLADIVVADSSAEVPEGYVLVGGTRLRKELYYKSGYWSSTESSFSVVDSTGAAATVFPGDVVVIDTHADVSAAWVADTFPANVTSIRIATNFTFHSGVSAAIFGGVTVAVDDGVALTLNNSGSKNSITLGAVTLNGPGSVAVTDTIAVSGAVSGTAALTISGTVNVASGGSIANAVAGTGTIAYAAIPAATPSSFTGWTGTVSLLPSFSASSGVNFNSYGTTGSTVALAGMTGGYILAAGKTVSPTLRLDGNMSITDMSPWTYTFAEITGTGNMSFATAENHPTSINITKLSGYTGAITNNTEATLTIGTLALGSGADVSACAKLLSTGGTGSFSVTAVTVGGEAQTLTLSYRSDGVYVRGVASYDNVEYETIAEAIVAAVNAGDTYEDVTIIDENAPCPDGYYIDTENNNALAMYQAAYVLTDSTKAYFKTAQLAVNSIQTAENATAYKFSRFEVYYGTEAAMSINLSAAAWSSLTKTVKVKCLDGATVVVTTPSDEYTLSASAPDEDGIVTYAKTAKAATYVWAAASQSQWSRPTNWKVGSAEGATAARAPSETDTAILGNGANVSGVDTVLSVAALQVSGAVTIVGGGTLTSANEITLGASDSITITGTLSPTPTTNVSHSRVKTVTVDDTDTTTYSVELIPGTIFSVY